jgi:hypothetical protein
MEMFFAVTLAVLGVALFAKALRRAIRARGSPITCAVTFVQAIGLISLALGWFGVLPLQTAVWVQLLFSVASVIMLSAREDPKKTGAVISGSL